MSPPATTKLGLQGDPELLFLRRFPILNASKTQMVLISRLVCSNLLMELKCACVRFPAFLQTASPRVKFEAQSAE